MIPHLMHSHGQIVGHILVTLFFLETANKLSGSLLAIFQQAPRVRATATLQGKPNPHRNFQGKIIHM